MNEYSILASDDDGHWFVIPEALAEEFDRLIDKGYETNDFTEFDDMFRHMAINGGPGHIRFTKWNHRF